MKYSAEIINKTGSVAQNNKENLVSTRPVEDNGLYPGAVRVDIEEKTVNIQNSPNSEPNRPVVVGEPLVLNATSLQKSELKNSPSPQPQVTSKDQGLKFPFANAKPVTVKLLKPKDPKADNRPNVFLQVKLSN
jgi:hypothetical protein